MWHTVQDQQITDALESIDKVYNHPSVVRRLWALTEEFIADKHLLGIHTVKSRDDTFSVLDVGCGTGSILQRIGIRFPKAQLFGIDANTASIERARAKRIENLQCDTFDKIEGTYDIVICSEVFEHVEDAEGLLDILRDRVAPGGYLSISTPSGWMYRTPRAYNAYKLLINPRRFWRLYLTPEKHWREAVEIHPAIMPGKLLRCLEQRGFQLVLRQSALWWFQEPGVAEKLFRLWGTKRAAIMFFHLNQFMDSAMNLLAFRLGETRAILLLRR